MSLADLDQSNFCQFTHIWLGPTIGWVMLPINPQTFVTTGTVYTVAPHDAHILLGPVAQAGTSRAIPYVSGVR